MGIFKKNRLPWLQRVQHSRNLSLDSYEKLDVKQQKHRYGVTFRLLTEYPLCLAGHLPITRKIYWNIHRRLYMAVRYGERLF